MRKFIAFVGHLRAGQFSMGPLRLFCSLKCASEAGFPLAQQVDEHGGGPLVDSSDRCFRCGADLWREIAAKPEEGHLP